MQKRLIQTLIRIVQSPETLFSASDALRTFHADYRLGHLKGRTRIGFTEDQKDEIAALLQSVAGIDARSVRIEDWQDATRAEALDLGNDEKLARSPVKRNRISLKALPGCDLRLNGQRIRLFPKAHIDVAWDTLASVDHELILLIENYECFNSLDEIADINTVGSKLGAEPLVVYRGDPAESRLDSVSRFLAASALPVVLFGDYDPASLMEAARFPNAVGMFVPSDIEVIMENFGNGNLYRQQVNAAFDRLASEQRKPIAFLYELLQTTRKGLPQEKLIGRGCKLEYHPFQ